MARSPRPQGPGQDPLTEPIAFRSFEQLLPDDAPEDIRRLVTYWIAKAGDRLMPQFADIDPTEIPWALGRVYLVRVVESGTDFVYRLTGERINERHGMSLTGKRPSDVFPPELARQIGDRWRRLVAEPAVCYTDSEHKTNAGWLMRARRVLLPLGPAGGPGDHVFGMTVFDAPSVNPVTIGNAGEVVTCWRTLKAPG